MIKNIPDRLNLIIFYYLDTKINLIVLNIISYIKDIYMVI